MDYLTTKQIQQQLLEMMVVVDCVFQQHDVRYSLDAGTLLGAVRHKGFIPWDDDVDVIVPRTDFERICEHPEWLPDGYKLVFQGKDDYLFPFAKVYNLSWRAQEPSIEGSLKEYLWLDIFPADAVPEAYAEMKELVKRQKRTHWLAFHALVNSDYATSVAKNGVKRMGKRILLPILRAVFPACASYKRLTQHALAFPFGSTSRVGNLVWGPYLTEIPSFPTSDFDNLITLSWEGHEFNACPHWDEYLTSWYGDYMTLPPIDQRRTHGIKAWASE